MIGSDEVLLVVASASLWFLGGEFQEHCWQQELDDFVCGMQDAQLDLDQTIEVVLVS